MVTVLWSCGTRTLALHTDAGQLVGMWRLPGRAGR
jgi:hypothetical protein